ncbi:hypothetical protein [Nocardia sp. NPDC048505]|uniref:hypothetical protein n=1 Tax=unclassified Nocardia TaxID=2637762 RepID=UPI003406405A
MRSPWALGLALAAAITCGCGSTADEPSSSPGGVETVVTIRIASGAVDPRNTRTEAKVGQPIVLRVDSDAADELHVHSDPAHTFAVAPRAGQEFRFTVGVPGQVAVELHELDQTVTTLQVRP